LSIGVGKYYSNYITAQQRKRSKEKAAFLTNYKLPTVLTQILLFFFGILQYTAPNWWVRAHKSNKPLKRQNNVSQLVQSPDL